MLVFRWVDDDLTAHEEFIGLYLTDSITAAALDVEMIKSKVNTQMHTFDFLFGISLGNLLLRHTQQDPSAQFLSATEGQCSQADFGCLAVSS